MNLWTRCSLLINNHRFLRQIYFNYIIIPSGEGWVYYGSRDQYNIKLDNLNPIKFQEKLDKATKTNYHRSTGMGVYNSYLDISITIGLLEKEQDKYLIKDSYLEHLSTITTEADSKRLKIEIEKSIVNSINIAQSKLDGLELTNNIINTFAIENSYLSGKTRVIGNSFENLFELRNPLYSTVLNILFGKNNINFYGNKVLGRLFDSEVIIKNNTFGTNRVYIDYCNLYNIEPESMRQLRELEKEGVVKFGAHNQKYRFVKSIHLPVKQEYQGRIKELNEILVHYIQKLTADESFAVEFESRPEEVVATFTSNQEISDEKFNSLREDFFHTLRDYVTKGTVELKPYYFSKMSKDDEALARYKIRMDLYAFVTELQIIQSIKGVEQEQQLALQEATKDLFPDKNAPQIFHVEGNVIQNTNTFTTTANNSQIVSGSQKVNQNQTTLTQPTNELNNFPAPAQPELAAQYTSSSKIFSILNSLRL